MIYPSEKAKIEEAAAQLQAIKTSEAVALLREMFKHFYELAQTTPEIYAAQPELAEKHVGYRMAIRDLSDNFEELLSLNLDSYAKEEES